jgi:hypothetical protein
MPPPILTSTTGTPTTPAAKPAKISTPLPSSATTSKKGIVTTIINGIEITIMPDSFVAPAKLGQSDGETDNPWSQSSYRNVKTKPNPQDKKNPLIKSFYLPPLKVTIFTVYKRGINPLNHSGYGRGTTTVDMAAGQISLQFHEGSHGQRALDFFTNNVPPTFGGKADMTLEDFKKAWLTYTSELKVYFGELLLRQRRDVDCVGTTFSGTFAGGTTCSTLATPNPKFK